MIHVQTYSTFNIIMTLGACKDVTEKKLEYTRTLYHWFFVLYLEYKDKFEYVYFDYFEVFVSQVGI